MFNKDGKQDTGKENSGHGNSGNRNSGNRNSGNRNSGNRNSGNWNSGHGNSGDWNSGNRNSGNWNSGHGNSGDWNSGHGNSGHGNSGNRNSGNWNSGHGNSGFFNTNEPTVRMFNQDTGLCRKDIDLPFLLLPVTEWVPEDQMTAEQKKADPDFHVKGGTLVTRTYKEAWQKAWNGADQETRDRFLNLPNFDPEIFKEITGIDVGCGTCDGQVVEINGKKYKLTEV